MRHILLALLLFPAVAHGQRRFDTADKILLVTSTLALAADWSTTVDGARRGAREYNPLLGSSPSVGRLNTYFAACALGNALLASRLSPTWRKILFTVVTLRSTHAALGNRSRGLRFSFQF